jgi:hypothetical protein
LEHLGAVPFHPEGQTTAPPHEEAKEPPELSKLQLKGKSVSTGSPVGVLQFLSEKKVWVADPSALHPVSDHVPARLVGSQLPSAKLSTLSKVWQFKSVNAHCVSEAPEPAEAAATQARTRKLFI